MKRDEFERTIREKVAQRGLTALVEKAVAAHVVLAVEHADDGSIERAVGKVTEHLSALAERKTTTRAERVAERRGWNERSWTKEGAR